MATICAAQIILAEAGTEDLVIGMSAVFSGNSRAVGIERYRGSMAYFREVNQNGGIGKRRIVVKAYDDGYNPTQTILNTIQLVEKDRVFLLFGYTGTPTVVRMLPLLQRYREEKILLFFPFSGVQLLRQPPYQDVVFNCRASNWDETAGLVDNLVSVGRMRFAVLYQGDAFGRSGWDGVRRALTRHGLRMVAEATYRRGTPFSESMRPQIDILRRANPDAVIAVATTASCAALIRDARDVGWEIPIAGLSGSGIEVLVQMLQEAGHPSGRDYTKNILASQVVPSYENTTLPAVREYRMLMDRHRPMPSVELVKEPYEPLQYTFASLEGFLDAKLLIEIFRRMGANFDRARLREAAESIKDFDLGIGVKVSFSPTKHQALDQVYYATVKDGRIIPLTDWSAWK